tara:strand:+ start:7307 stop:7846 length:540 start_codon:yes stop_codon:yes gene_type:complete
MKGMVVRGVTIVLCLFASACALSGNDQPYDCPSVYILQDAKTLTRFRPGLGRDITDTQFQAELIDFEGKCEYADEANQWKVNVELLVRIYVERGLANRGSTIALEYFVVLPNFEGNAGGKQVFLVEGEFEKGRKRLIYKDEVKLKIPLKDPDEGKRAQIVLGFQLTPDELNYNRMGQRQ